jgi:hypothetical protein
MTLAKFVRSLSSTSIVLFGMSFAGLGFAADVATAAAPDAATTASTTAPATDAAASIGQVIWVKGSVQAAQGTAAPRTLERRSQIFQGDVIKTDPSGSGEIAFADSSVVSLRSSTEFKIDSFHYKPGSAPGESKSVMGLVKGGFRTITGAIPKENPEAYQMNTPVATIGVRGTDYSAYYSAAEGLVTKIDVGKIYLKNDAGTIELDKALAQVYATVRFNQPPTLTDKAPGIFNAQPPLTPVAPATINNIQQIGPGYTMPGGGPMPTPPKTVSNFCISLLQQAYEAITAYLA